MRIATVVQDAGDYQAAFVVGDRVVTARRAARGRGIDLPSISDARDLLDLGADTVAVLAVAAATVAADGFEGEDWLVSGGAKLAAPVRNPEKIICVGMNFRDHAAEAGMPIPPAAPLFGIFRNALVGPDDEIVMPGVSEQIDWEGEIAIVIGTEAKNVSVEDAPKHIAGLTLFNDVSARDLQLETSQWFGGKGLDTFAPCGPHIVSLDELGDLGSLGIVTRVSGETMQDSTTAQMVWTFTELVAYISSLVTLQPGDVIATGTPAGIGFLREPQRFLRPGDTVEVEVEGLGCLVNRVVAAAAPQDVATAAA